MKFFYRKLTFHKIPYPKGSKKFTLPQVKEQMQILKPVPSLLGIISIVPLNEM